MFQLDLTHHVNVGMGLMRSAQSAVHVTCMRQMVICSMVTSLAGVQNLIVAECDTASELAANLPTTRRLCHLVESGLQIRIRGLQACNTSPNVPDG